MKWNKCIHGGGKACVAHGGTGELVHGPNFLHKHLHVRELINNTLVHDIGVLPTQQSIIKSLDSFFEDDDLAIELLSTSNEHLQKALYHFDLHEEEGIERILELLPILDDKVVRDVYATVFPNYPVDDDHFFNLRIARMELRGYFMDMLEGYNGFEYEDSQDQSENETGEQAPDEALADEARNQSPAGENVSEPRDLA